MPNYTQAIAVDNNFMYALLIKRLNNPGRGLLSGIGGHIEKGETPEQCIKREWQEEVGSPIPDDTKLFPIMSQTLPDCTNNLFGIIFPKIDIYFFHNTDGEGFIRWYHILGEHIMDNNNKNVAWDGLIPYCINLMKKSQNSNIM